MRRYFNTEGLCYPEKHYMVKLDERLEKIRRRYIERGSYFIINRGRQYGKTTTLRLLADDLLPEYFVLSLDFQEMSSTNFESEEKFVEGFTRCVIGAMEEQDTGLDAEKRKDCVSLLKGRFDMGELFERLSKICKMSERPVVLMIDEVDSASNNQVFIDFLAMLRRYYLNRTKRPIFQSVILAGVYDIKNLKLKIRPEEEHQYNSPWNIAAKFNIDMSFSAQQIAEMLQEYEEDAQTGMDVQDISACIYEYTSGYPYLVSAVCKIMDEELSERNLFPKESDIWTRTGVGEAVKVILKENISLFDSMIKQLNSYKELRDIIEQILYQGREISFSPAEKSINLGVMFGFLQEKNGHVVLANRIFEMYLLNLFISEESVRSEMFLYGQGNKNKFIAAGRLNMELVLKKFVQHFTDIYGNNDEKFVEEYGRKFFLLYLKPIINGVGNYYIEAQTRDARRTDVIVDYLGEQFVVELKIWHGSEYHERGEKQLTEYLNYYHKKKGYLVSFNFNKKKVPGVKEVKIGDMTIVEAVV